jgi:glycerophosphoryl diester phosphodiesterase
MMGDGMGIGFEIIAHRGASYVAPENTLGAFRTAWEDGADGIEGDFRLSADGHVVCHHDEGTGRMAGVDRRIAECTLDELMRLDVGMSVSPRWMGQRIPTLQQVAGFVPEGKRLFVEVKSGPESITAIKAALDEVESIGLSQVTVLAFNEAVVAASKSTMPDVRTHWLTRDVTSPGDILSVLNTVGADGVGCAYSEGIDADFVRAFATENKEFNVWTVDDVEQALRLQDCGITYLTTNRPGWMRQALGRV